MPVALLTFALTEMVSSVKLLVFVTPALNKYIQCREDLTDVNTE